jgi:hydroxylamine reductase
VKKNQDDFLRQQPQPLWYLLTLLALGVKHIHLGPTLPTFSSSNLAKVLMENFDINSTDDAVCDVAAIMAGN